MWCKRRGMPRLLPFLKGRGHRLEFVVGVMKVTNGRKGDAPRRECTAPRPRRGPRGGEAASKASPIQCRSIRSCRLYQAVPETRRAGVEGHARVDFRGTGPWMGRVGAKADVEEEPSKEERRSVRRLSEGGCVLQEVLAQAESRSSLARTLKPCRSLIRDARLPKSGRNFGGDAKARCQTHRVQGSHQGGL